MRRDATPPAKHPVERRDFTRAKHVAHKTDGKHTSKTYSLSVSRDAKYSTCALKTSIWFNLLTSTSIYIYITDGKEITTGTIEVTEIVRTEDSPERSRKSGRSRRSLRKLHSDLNHIPGIHVEDEQDVC